MKIIPLRILKQFNYFLLIMFMMIKLIKKNLYFKSSNIIIYKEIKIYKKDNIKMMKKVEVQLYKKILSMLVIILNEERKILLLL